MMYGTETRYDEERLIRVLPDKLYRGISDGIGAGRIPVRIVIGGGFIYNKKLLESLFVRIEGQAFRSEFLSTQMPFAEVGGSIAPLQEEFPQGLFFQGKEFLPFRFQQYAVTRTRAAGQDTSPS
jgi:hypothetical protein